MAKRVYFCFHYQDVIDFRANVVRNAWVTKKDREAAGYFDASLWEEAESKSAPALKRLINSGLVGTTVTAILIGSETFCRPWVRYEIFKSVKRGNKCFAVHINGIPGKNRRTKYLGPNPFLYLGVTYSSDGSTLTMWEKVGAVWLRYAEIDGSASYFVQGIPRPRWGKGFNLTSFYSAYLWNRDDGHANFSSWVSDDNT